MLLSNVIKIYFLHAFEKILKVDRGHSLNQSHNFDQGF